MEKRRGNGNAYIGGACINSLSMRLKFSLRVTHDVRKVARPHIICIVQGSATFSEQRPKANIRVRLGAKKSKHPK